MRKPSYYFYACVLPAVLLIGILQPALGQTQPSLQSKQQSLSSSAGHLMTWERLSGQFGETLQAHEATLTELSQKLETSERNGQLLTGLLEQLSAQNESLKNYNTQIGERMQERDEDLAYAYDKIDRLEKSRLQLIIAVTGMGSIILISVVLFTGRLLLLRR